MEKRKIHWEHYSYSYLENESKFVKDADEDKHPDEPPTYDDEPTTLKDLVENVGRIVQTPFGMFQVDDELNPFRQFTFWMGHTNFDITAAVTNVLESIEGVEVLHIFSRYRFIIAFGPLFDGATVKYRIQRALCGEQNNQNIIIEEKISHLKEELSGYPKWSIYVLPNGNYSFTFLQPDKSNLKEYEDKILFFSQAQKISNGIIINHDS